MDVTYQFRAHRRLFLFELIFSLRSFQYFVWIVPFSKNRFWLVTVSIVWLEVLNINLLFYLKIVNHLARYSREPTTASPPTQNEIVDIASWDT